MSPLSRDPPLPTYRLCLPSSRSSSATTSSSSSCPSSSSVRSCSPAVTRTTFETKGPLQTPEDGTLLSTSFPPTAIQVSRSWMSQWVRSRRLTGESNVAEVGSIAPSRILRTDPSCPQPCLQFRALDGFPHPGRQHRLSHLPPPHHLDHVQPDTRWFTVQRNPPVFVGPPKTMLHLSVPVSVSDGCWRLGWRVHCQMKSSDNDRSMLCNSQTWILAFVITVLT